MSNIEPDDLRDELAKVTTFVPQEIELIDPEWHGPHETFRPVRRPRKWLPMFLFVATCCSTFWIGIFIENLGRNPPLASLLLNGLRYSVAVMSILLAHEMGHYLVARYHRVPASLPYFIPMPIGPLGTMGAVIVQGRGVADRRQMFDIAIAGPLAGLVLAIPIAWFGMAETQKSVIEPGQVGYILGDPLVMQWMTEHFHGPVAKNEIVAKPPLLMAGWVGIFVTALNLIPIGQLDGGHLLYCLIGRRAHRVAIGMLLFAIGWMVYTENFGYMLIAVLLIIFGPRHPPTANDYIPLGRARVVAGWLTLAFIIIGFTPVPITVFGAAVDGHRKLAGRRFSFEPPHRRADVHRSNYVKVNQISSAPMGRVSRIGSGLSLPGYKRISDERRETETLKPTRASPQQKRGQVQFISRFWPASWMSITGQ